MLLKIVYLLTCRVLGLAVLVFRADRAKDAELHVLRHENAVLRRNVSRVRYDPADRVWFAAVARLLPRRRWAGIFPVTPATLLAWQRKLAGSKYDTSHRPPCGEGGRMDDGGAMVGAAGERELPGLVGGGEQGQDPPQAAGASSRQPPATAGQSQPSWWPMQLPAELASRARPRLVLNLRPPDRDETGPAGVTRPYRRQNTAVQSSGLINEYGRAA